jgi:hypothetical protein
MRRAARFPTTAVRSASAGVVVAATALIYWVIDRTEDCDRTTTEWPSDIAILSGGFAFFGAAYVLMPSHWNVAARVTLSIALGAGATFGFFVLDGLTWAAKCSN